MCLEINFTNLCGVLGCGALVIRYTWSSLHFGKNKFHSIKVLSLCKISFSWVVTRSLHQFRSMPFLSSKENETSWRVPRQVCLPIWLNHSAILSHTMYSIVSWWYNYWRKVAFLHFSEVLEYLLKCNHRHFWPRFIRRGPM